MSQLHADRLRELNLRSVYAYSSCPHIHRIIIWISLNSIDGTISTNTTIEGYGIFWFYICYLKMASFIETFINGYGLTDFVFGRLQPVFVGCSLKRIFARARYWYG